MRQGTCHPPRLCHACVPTRVRRPWNWRACMMTCEAVRMACQPGLAAGGRLQVEAPDPVQVCAGEASGLRIERTAGRQLSGRPQHQGAVRRYHGHGHQPLPVGRHVQPLTHLHVLGFPPLSSLSQLYQPARPTPICTSQGRTCPVGAGKVVAIVQSLEPAGEIPDSPATTHASPAAWNRQGPKVPQLTEEGPLLPRTPVPRAAGLNEGLDCHRCPRPHRADTDRCQGCCTRLTLLCRSG
jgi:hypothetical protein